ncbi:MAG: hypothetical protein HY718_07170, partial [Planctomycetes bacterium]|nr:hypothetical protein [Planctomycetota bacterium]
RELLERHQACPEAVIWADQYKTLEEMWQECPHPEWMLWSLEQLEYADDAKLRTFAACCARRLWPLLDDRRSRQAIEAAERVARGEIDRSELTGAWRAGKLAADEAPRRPGWDAAHAAAQTAASHTALSDGMVAAKSASKDALRAVAWYTKGGVTAEAEEEWQANELRRIIGSDITAVLQRAKRRMIVEEGRRRPA